MKTGIVYKIVHNQSDILYVGSTLDKLNYRWRNHKGHFKAWKDQRGNKCSIYPYFAKFGTENFSIIKIKSYDVVDKKHLLAYEQLWINKLKCINQVNPFYIRKMGKKCYREKNKEKIKQKKKEYYEANKDAIRAREKRWCEENKAHIREQRKQYREKNKEKAKAYHKKYREDKKEELLQKKKEYYENNKEELYAKQRAYCEQNKESIKKYKQAHYEKNKEKIKAKQLPVTCEVCSKVLSCQSSLTRHRKNKHN